MIKKIALAALFLGLTAGIGHTAPAPQTTSTPAAHTAIAPDWGVKRQTVGFKRRGFRGHRGFRRGGFGFRRGFRGHRFYRGGRGFRGHRFYGGYGYGHRRYYGGFRVRGVGTVR
ncbi:MAG: hypothetical protein AAGI06_13430 [Pseudomonadota bacterium]